MIIIDRFEGDFSVCEADGKMVEIKKEKLSEGLSEGDVIFFNGTCYVKDEAATNERISRIKKLFERKK